MSWQEKLRGLEGTSHLDRAWCWAVCVHLCDLNKKMKQIFHKDCLTKSELFVIPSLLPLKLLISEGFLVLRAVVDFVRGLLLQPRLSVAKAGISQVEFLDSPCL